MERYDFSKALLRCHAIYFLVSRGKEKTGKLKYEECQAELDEEYNKYDELEPRLQRMKRGLSKAAKIAGLEQKLVKLEPNRFDDPIPQGAKSYLKRLYAEVKYHKWSASQTRGNKYTEKGLVVQQTSLALISSLDGYEYPHNEERIQNGFLTGIPDTFRGKSLQEAEYIPEIKSPYDFETFLENVDKPLNPLYWWQLQGYLDLTGAKSGEVSYCLVNTPDYLINGECRRLFDKLGCVTDQNPEYVDKSTALINNLTFDDIEPGERRLKFPIERNEDAIQMIHDVVPKCRQYLEEIQEMHLTGVFSDKELPILDTLEEI